MIAKKLRLDRRGLILNKGIGDFSVGTLKRRRKNYNFDFDVFLKTKGVNLQRPLVWSLLQKRELILSILKGSNIPPISVAFEYEGDENSETKKILVIDGKQRLTTIIDFIDDKFTIEFEKVEYYYSTLPEEDRIELNQFYLLSDQLYSEVGNLSDDILIQWFTQINFAGTPQDKDHQQMLRSLL